MIDYDSADSVIAASTWFTGGVNASTGHAGRAAGEFVFGDRPQSDLDYRLVAVRDRIARWFAEAVDDIDTHSATTHGDIVGTANLLDATDRDGGTQVRMV
ncbi:hypothetical protein [Nocardia veterana]|uniref:Uncharacterized protein n=1 Tax=Nocardia veterana TaxID=132249 RepID=A0A7X6M0K8_9NOCA|nr:hypothetical protein [Nocardia veterana]NKY87235.1 hypothetical protein [Nocardia veterana]